MTLRYEMDAATIPAGPEAAMTGETLYPGKMMAQPQEAVNAARAFVRDHPGPDLPRAKVTRRVPGYQNPRNAPRVIFRAWRTPDGAYHEERIPPPKG